MIAMKSPFPGMNPYLEDPALWPGLHSKLATYMVETLNEKLPEDYVSDLDFRLYVTHRNSQIIPDVTTLSSRSQERAPVRSGGVAVMSRADAPQILITEREEVSEPFIEIRSLTEPKKVVTVIEILRHSNKKLGSEGRESYLTKQSEILRSDVNLLEIDLLRKGEYTLAPPYERIVFDFGYWDYVVSLSRSSNRKRFELHLRTVKQKLPCFRVPLLEGDPDMELDLQAIFDRCYQVGAYWRQIDYRRNLHYPLNEPDAEWAKSIALSVGA